MTAMTEIRLNVRLNAGVALCEGVKAASGGNEDIELVLAERPDFFRTAGKQLVELSRRIKSDHNCFRLTDDGVLFTIPSLKRPSLEELQNDWSDIRSIESDCSTEAAVVFRLATVLLKSDGECIDGATYGRRIAWLRADSKLLGFQHREWFLKHWNDEKAIPDANVRAALKTLIGKVYIDFPAIVVVDDDGYRNIPYADNDDERCGGWYWLGSAFLWNGRVAVSGK